MINTIKDRLYIIGVMKLDRNVVCVFKKYYCSVKFNNDNYHFYSVRCKLYKYGLGFY